MDNMDRTTIVSTATQTTGNVTEVIVVEEQRVETLTIIVWCIGGFLLISLLSLLGRIILSKKKHPFRQFDYIDPMPFPINGIEIRIGGRRISASSTPRSHSRDTTDLVPRCEVNVTETPRSSQNMAGPTIVESDQRNPQTSIRNIHQSVQTPIVTHDLNSGAYTTQTLPRIAQLLRTDENGSRATINGYIIRPPPYREVVSSSNRIPSVIVTREQSHVNTDRRQMFSL